MPSAAIAATPAIAAVPGASSLLSTPARTTAGADPGGAGGSFAQALEEATPAPASAAKADTPPIVDVDADDAAATVAADPGAAAPSSIDLALMTQLTAQRLPQGHPPTQTAQAGTAQAQPADATAAAPTPTSTGGPASSAATTTAGASAVSLTANVAGNAAPTPTRSSRQAEAQAPIDPAAATELAPSTEKTASGPEPQASDVTPQANAAAAVALTQSAVAPALATATAGPDKPVTDRTTPATAARGKDTQVSPRATHGDAKPEAESDPAPAQPVSPAPTSSPATPIQPAVDPPTVTTAGIAEADALGLPSPSTLAATGAISHGAASTAPPAASLHQAHIAPRLDQPTFAPALGAQISVMARDGISEARLHLNPAEMGPVSVQISVTGQAARVELVAEHALTRHVLEQSMPTLAGALRESGLTLAGGGVFEQHRQPMQQDQNGSQRPSRQFANDGARADGADTPAATVRAPVPRRGVVDLYA